MEDTEFLNKKPSIAAIQAIKDAVSFGVDSAEKLIDKIEYARKIVYSEGFTEEQFQGFARPFLKQARLSKGQIRYLFNIEEMKESSKEQYQRQKRGNITPNDDKKEMEQSSNIEIKTEQLPESQPIVYGESEYPPEEPELAQSDYRTVIANLTIETEDANLDLPVTVRLYYNGNVELEKFTCNQIKLLVH